MADYLIRVRDATAALDAAADPDDLPVRTALALAARAWPAVYPSTDRARARWASFGPGVHEAAVALWPDGEPVDASTGGPLPDTAELRTALATLVTAVAARLDAGVDDPAAPAPRRWVWAYAAAQLRQAATDLAGPP